MIEGGSWRELGMKNRWYERERGEKERGGRIDGRGEKGEERESGGYGESEE